MTTSKILAWIISVGVQPYLGAAMNVAGVNDNLASSGGAMSNIEVDPGNRTKR